jgi:hypothetical protein
MPSTDFVRDSLPTRGRAGRSWTKSGSTGVAREGPESVPKLPWAGRKGCARSGLSVSSRIRCGSRIRQEKRLTSARRDRERHDSPRLLLGGRRSPKLRPHMLMRLDTMSVRCLLCSVAANRHVAPAPRMTPRMVGENERAGQPLTRLHVRKVRRADQLSQRLCDGEQSALRLRQRRRTSSRKRR